MKQCSKCGKVKSETEFSKKGSGLQSWCKLCIKEYDKKRFSTDEYRKYKRSINEQGVKRCRDYVRNYLKSHPCIDCDEKDIVVLEFDHLKNKTSNISELVNRGSRLKLESEIKKCVVRCANCHRRKTARQFGYYRGFA